MISDMSYNSLMSFTSSIFKKSIFRYKILTLILLRLSLPVYAGVNEAFNVLDFGLKLLTTPSVGPDTNYVEQLNNRRKKLRGDVDITFNSETIKNCKRLKMIRIKSSYSNKPLVSNSVYCDIDYKVLTDEVLFAGGNVLFINMFSDKCDISTYQSFAYRCSESL